MSEVEGALGATPVGRELTRFVVWAPHAESVEVHVVEPVDRFVRMEARSRGYHEAVVEGVGPGSLYRYRLESNLERPDPASHFQPRGVHGPSQVVDPAFAWDEVGWSPPTLEQLVLYELHVGTFSASGTFDGVVPHLAGLRELGVTGIELMPVAQFPGTRNWGYDGAYPFAVQDSYGGPGGLRRLVQECHRREIALYLDVVYNHLGPEGSYLAEFGPYYTDVYHTPWGAALNFDGPGSDEVRRYFVDNAVRWVRDFRVDGLRVDAVQTIVDRSPRTFLEQLTEAVHGEAARLGRRVHVIAETDANDPRLVERPEIGGLGFDASWNDDFHHAVHSLLTDERMGYQRDYGDLGHLARVMEDRFAYAGDYSRHRARRHGCSAAHLPARHFVVCAQNHDHVGNRPNGERLSALVDFEALKLAAALLILSPFVPLLFMGEEYGETAPFRFFTSHGDEAVARAVHDGRRAEQAAFGWNGEPFDPQDEATFLGSRLDHGRKGQGRQRMLLAFHRELLRLRREEPALVDDRPRAEVIDESSVLVVTREAEEREALLVYHLSGERRELRLPARVGEWAVALRSDDRRWGGGRSDCEDRMESDGKLRFDVSPWSATILVRERRS